MDISAVLGQRAPGLILDRDCRPAAVGILLLPGKMGPEVLFEVRSPRILEQPGDICFPGGMLEAGESPLEAARRECCEELLIRDEQLTLLGAGDYLRAGDVLIYPFVMELKDYTGGFSADEVGAVFRVPLEYFLRVEPDCYRLSFRPEYSEEFPYERIAGGREYRWRSSRQDMYFWTYEGRTIWGMTAKILKSLIDRLKEAEGACDDQ